jgi:hypothetical protein
MIAWEHSPQRHIDMGGFCWEFSQGSIILGLLSQKLSPRLHIEIGASSWKPRHPRRSVLIAIIEERSTGSLALLEAFSLAGIRS